MTHFGYPSAAGGEMGKRSWKVLMLVLLPVLLSGSCTDTPILVTVLPTPTLQEPVHLTRGPYLQSVTPTSIVVAWEMDRPAPAAVAWGETEAHGWLAEDPQIVACHAVTLTNLSPYTRYHYRVLSGGLPLSDDYTFRTAAAPDQTRFSFAVFGDTRTQDRFHRAVVERILALQPDFVLHTGDLVAHGHSNHEWQTFFEIERELLARVPFFPTLGNHEANNPLYRELFYLPGNERWYSFDYGHVHFVCLQVDNIADLSPQGEQIRWLQEDLASTEQPWKVLFFHVPPFSSLGEEEDEVHTRRALASVLTDQGVQIVFTGHHHNYQRLQVGGVTYVVTGGGGAPLYPLQEQDPELAAYAAEYHAVLITLDGPAFTAVVVSAEGEELDRFELELP
ncbi:MAG TPA: metallophosphoesterase family protein [Anaerolineae bacterium]|nr:metallophosphoesterase family protein [Anaerolineae bacterium]